MSEISKLKVAQLRKLAEEKAVEGWQDMDKKGLVAALQALDAPAAPTAPEEPKVGEKSPEPKSVVPEGSRVAYEGKVAKMKEHLDAQSKVRILVPLESGEKKGATLAVTLNGYRLNIMKGVYVEVPEQVAEVVMDSQKQSNVLVEHPLKVDESNSALNQ